MGKRGLKLTARKVETAGTGRHIDGDGLMLVVGASGSKSWILRYQMNKRRQDMGLGRYPDVPLQKARERVREMRALIADGIDPKLARRREALTFRKAAEQLIEAKAAGWRNAKHAAQWPNTLRDYVYPTIGDRDVASIDIQDVLAVLQPIWTKKPETASRVRQRIEAVLASATAKKARSGPNPAVWRGNLDTLLPQPTKVRAVQHHAAIPWQDIPSLWKSLEGRDSVSAVALRFILLTAARSGEVRGAIWQEIDVDQALWVVPASRMKAGQEHRVPLSTAALAVIGEPGRPDAFVFPSPRAKAMSDVAVSKILKSVVASATVHGLRSSFRDWAGETTSHPREVIEHALAHQLRDKAEAAYARGTLFQKRRKLMEDWAAFVTSPPGDVVSITDRRVGAMS